MTKKLNRLVVLILLCLPACLNAQVPDTLNTRRIVPLAAGAGVVFGGTLLYLSNQWYDDYEKQSFQFFDDSKEWKQVDKAGHIYGAYQMQRAGYAALRWTGLNEKKSLLWSAVSGFVFITSIEVLDGYSAGYGASVSDAVANLTGIGLFTLQQAGWKEIRIHPKFSYSPTSYPPLRPGLLGDGWHEELVKDYNGQTYWLSVDLSAFTKRKFPKWLNVAVGYGAEDMIYARDHVNEEAGFSPYRQWYIGPDIDLSHIRTNSGFLNTALFLVNMIRIPAPALEYNRHGWHWHWLK